MFGAFRSNGTLVDPILDGTPSGTAVGTASGLATLDGTGILALSQRFIDALSTPTNTRAGAGSALGSGDNNNVFGANGFSSITSGNRNTGMGHEVLFSITGQSDNTGIGHFALRSNTASENTGVGSYALSSNTTSTKNTGVGFNALRNNLAGTGSNTAMGHQSMLANTAGSFNTAVGVDSLMSAATGSSNATLGINTLRSNTAPTQNTAVGAGAMSVGTSGSNNTGIGYNALLSATASSLTAVGAEAMQSTTTGIEGTAVGFQALTSQNIGNSNTAFGFQAGSSVTSGDDNMAIGSGALSSASSASGNMAIGNGALASMLIFGNNMAIGNLALNASTSISPNTAIGFESMMSNTFGSLNTSLGYHSLNSNTTGSGNTSLGHDAMLSNIAGSSNTAVGREALRDNTATGNTAIGFQAAASNTTGTDITAVGFSALAALVGGISNTAMGSNALDSCTTGNQNTGVGTNVLDVLTTGSNNVGMGDNALGSSNGSRNTAIGSLAMNLSTGANDSTGLGYQSLSNNTASELTGIGAYALASNTTGTENTGVGYGALRANVGGSRNTGVGHSVLDSNTSGNDNTSMGYGSMTALTTGDFNSGFGSNSLAATTDGTFNSAFGGDALAANTSGDFNVSVGYGSLRSVVNQQGNIAMGYLANDSAFTADDTISFGRNSESIGNGGIAIGGSGIAANAAQVMSAGGIGIGQQTSVGALNAIAIGTGAIANVAHRVQLGEAIDSGTNATMMFRSQIIGDESWISAGTFAAAIDASGNIIKTAVPVGGGSGETNTVSNQGVGGVGLFKQKTGVDFEFRNINAGTNRITVTLDAVNDEVDIDVAEANVDHDALLNYVGNEHVDHSTVTITGGTGLSGGGDITTSRTLDLDVNGLLSQPAPVGADEIAIYDASLAAHRKTTVTAIGNAIGAEANTGSNQGTAGVGVFLQKTGVDLEFKNINAGSSKVTVTDDVAENEIDIDVDETAIDHDNLLNFVANEHIDHSAVNINGGVGISGGGDITTDRTLDLDINGLMTEAVPVGADFLPIYDTSATAIRKVTLTSLGNAIGGETNTASNQGAAGVGVFIQKTGDDLEFKNINVGSSKVTVTNDMINNEIDIDVDETAINHDNLLGFVANEHVDHSTINITAGVGLNGGGDLTASRTIDLDINSLTSEPIPVSTDELVIYDTSAAAHRKITIAALSIASGGESNTASNQGAAGVGVFLQKTGVDLEFKNINSGSNKITVANDAINNEIDIDVDETNIVHDNLSGFVANEHVDHSAVNITGGLGLGGGGDLTASRTIDLDLNSLMTEATPLGVDFIPFYDISAGIERKATITSIGTAIGAESNTASNQGVGGVGVFIQKTGVDLEFKNINAGSNKITVTDDMGNDEIDIDVVDANIDHDALTNFVANEHIDHTAVNITGGVGLNGGGDLTASRTIDLDINSLTVATPAGADEVAIYDASAMGHRKTTLSNLGTAIGSESNTASNVGTAGVGVFLQKTGVDLEFKNINAGSSKITVTDDVANSEIDVDVDETAINHDNLLGFVANEHVDHSTINLTAGEGLSGGGDITSSRTFDLDVTNLASEAAPVLTDEMLIYDVSEGAHNKITLTQLQTLIDTGEGNTASNQGTAGTGVFIQKTGVDLEFKNINAGSNKITITDDVANNEIDIDVVDSNIDHDALTNFVANEHIDHSTVNITAGVGLLGGGDLTASRTIDLDINGLTSEPMPVSTDEIAIYDISAAAHRKITIAALSLAAGGESNTASNQGTAGTGVFIQKSGVDLEFKNINAGSNKITITDDVTNNEIDIDVDETNIDHDALTNFVANEHIDHSAVNLTAGVGLSGGGDLTASRTFDLDINGLTNEPTPVSTDEIAIYDISAAAHRKITIAALSIASGGEANTASNQGTAGVGVFVQKSGVDLEFKNVNAGSSKITVTDDLANNEIDIDVDETAINHDNLLGFVANEHVDHSTVTLTAGEGLSGGGDITASRTFDLDFNNLTAEAAPALTDEIAIYDVSEGAHNKITLTQLQTLTSVTASNEGTAGTGVFIQKTGGNLEFKNINAGSSKVTVTNDMVENEIDIDVDETAINHDNLLGFVANEHVDHSTVNLTAGVGLSGGGDITASRTFDLDVNGLTVGTPVVADEVPIYDVSGGVHRKVTITSIGNAIGAESNTASNQGVGGVGLFKQKTGVDLEFKNINAGSSKITVVDDPGNDEVDIDVDETQINHDNLLGFVANEHVDHSTVNLTAGEGLSGGGNITASRTFDIDFNGLATSTPVAADELAFYDSSLAGHRKVTVTNFAAAIGAEANTASNQGTAGVGVFIQKTGLDLEFKNINSGSSKVTVANDMVNNEIDIDVDETEINHDNLLNFVADEHVAHSAVVLTAGEGLSGGGDITTSRTFDLDVTGLTAGTPVLTDEMAIYDVSLGGHRKITLTQLQTLVDTGEDNTASNQGTAGVGVFIQKTGADLEFKNINTGSSKVTVTNDVVNNEIDIDVDETEINHDNLLGFVANEHVDHSTVNLTAGEGLTGGGDITSSRTFDLDVTGLTAGTPVLTDEMAIYDVSLGGHRKVTLTQLQTLIDTGETNTASNIGTAGVGVFDQKVGADLQFRNINNGSNKISITDDAANNEIDIDVVEANIVHDNLSGFVANEHVDHSTVNLTAGEGLSGGGDITASRTFDLDVTNLTSTAPVAGDELVVYDVSLAGHRKTTVTALGNAIGAESNTASNQGVGGVGVFIQKTGVDLEFKNINAGSSKITVVDDMGNNEIDIDVDETQINHDNLLGFVANEHVDHSTVNLTAGEGLSGGGNITASRTFDLDFTNLAASTPVSADEIAFYDVSVAGHRKVTVTDLGTAIGAVTTASNEGIAGVGVFIQKTGSNLEYKNINIGSNKISVTDDVANDEIDIDVVEANVNHDNLLNYVANEHVDHSTVTLTAGEGISGGGDITASRTFDLDFTNLATEASPVLADEMAIYDVSEGAHNKITLTQLGTLLGTGGEANTASNIGTAGVGVFDQKVGSDLQFRNINNGSSKITVTDDVANNEIDIDVDETAINHDNLLNFVANEHVDHSSVTLTAGEGLSGGGDITASRTFDLDVNGLTSATPTSSDELVIYDVSALAHRKITVGDIQSSATIDRVSVAAAGASSPSAATQTTFITTTSAGVTATGTLGNGTSDGQVKYIVATSLLADYTLTVTNGVESNGTSMSTIVFDSTGQSIQLIWDATDGNWFIANAGASVS